MKIDMIVSTVSGDEEYTEVSQVLGCVTLEGKFSIAARRKRDGCYSYHQTPVQEVKTVSVFFTHEEDDVHPQV